MSQPTHLVVVCGHAIWKGGPRNGLDESEWLIEGYKQGETPTFIEHIKAGVRILGEDDSAILVFSGGPTRPEVNLSEARSYANLAAASSYYNLLPPGHADPVATARVLLEERALDSYANILFSLVAFWRAHAAWPQRLTLVSHEFKRARLVDAHCAAIGFPPDRVAFVGISPPDLRAVGSAAAADDDDLERAAAEPGRLAAAKAAKMRDVHAVVGAWMRDPHGVGETLAGKRRQRNCWGVDQMLFRDEEERSRSGLKTRVLDDGVEALIDDAPRPWAYASSGR